MEVGRRRSPTHKAEEEVKDRTLPSQCGRPEGWLPEDLGSGPSTHITWLTTTLVTLVPGYLTPLLNSVGTAFTDLHTDT